MEFWFRAGEQRDVSFSSAPAASSSSFSYFAGQAMCTGFVGDIGWVHPATRLEILQRKLMEEQIQDEIITRQVVRRRMLEEQVRREMEMENAMVLAPVDVGVQRFRPNLVPHHREVEFDNRRPLPYPGIKARRKASKPMLKKITKITARRRKFSGIKKKAQNKLSCALCQVSALSEESLKEHLRGKRHKAKVAEQGVEAVNAWKTMAAQGSNKVAIKVDGELHQVVQKRNSLWCVICNVKCSSTDSMITHLSGKSHKSMISKNFHRAGKWQR